MPLIIDMIDLNYKKLTLNEGYKIMQKIIFGLIILSCSLMQAELYNDQLPGVLNSNLRPFTPEEQQEIAQAEEIMRNTELDKKYTNTKFLAQYDKVRQELIKDFGFTQELITTDDGTKIDALVLSQPEAKKTVILSAGFYAGRIEGNAHIMNALAQRDDVNIIFIHTRRHGPKGRICFGPKNNGLLSHSNIRNMGDEEWIDHIGAYNYAIEKFENTKLLCIGICAGSYHMTRAHTKLQEQVKAKNILPRFTDTKAQQAQKILDSIEGYWFDSAWTNVHDTTRNALRHEVPNVITKMFLPKSLPKTVSKTANFFIGHSLLWWHSCCIAKHQKQLPDTKDEMANINKPVVIAQSQQDLVTPLTPLFDIANKRFAANLSTFIIQPDYHQAFTNRTKIGHTQFGIKQFQRYKPLLYNFIENPADMKTNLIPKPTQPEQPTQPDKSLSGISTLEKW